MKTTEALDLIKMKAFYTQKQWWEHLCRLQTNMDINRLAELRSQLQAGMNRLAKLKLNDQKMIHFFLCLQRDVERTARAVIRKRHPNPCDKGVSDTKNALDWIEIKRRRDRELEAFFKKKAY